MINQKHYQDYYKYIDAYHSQKNYINKKLMHTNNF